MTSLPASEAAHQFSEFVRGIARQHLRVRLRNAFGTGKLNLDPKIFRKDAVAAEPDKIVRNLLQEQPGLIEVIGFAGSAKELEAWRDEKPDASKLSELLHDTREQGLIVTGHKARLFVYFDPAHKQMVVAREAIEPPVQEKKPAAKPKARRKKTPYVPEKKISQRPGRNRR